MRVLVTRAEPAASRTKRKLVAIGHDPVLLPIFELVDTGGKIPENNYDGVIFTSANAVEVLSRRGWKPSASMRTAFCVGSRTAEAAKDLGFYECVVASGGGVALCEKIGNLSLPQNYRFFCPTTPDRSFDMRDHLALLGYCVDLADIYQTRKISFPHQTLQNAMKECKNGAVLVYSARSAGYLAELLDTDLGKIDISAISLVGISKSATNIMLKYPWRDVYVSNNPDEETMLSLLGTITSA